MSTYVIGDIQGCLEPLERLLEAVSFSPLSDELWLVGDLVNRGPSSLEVVRFVRALGDRCKVVLGNHDLHFLAVAVGVRKARKGDTLDKLLAAPDLKDHIDWFRHVPVAHFSRDTLMVHAGVAPRWSLEQTLSRAAELESALRGERFVELLRDLFANSPATYKEKLTAAERTIAITNTLTRLRFCGPNGKLDFDYKGPKDRPPPGMKPWFAHKERVLRDTPIVFGHWAALEGKTGVNTALALDTGCVWGKRLTALDLSTGNRHSVAAQRSKQ